MEREKKTIFTWHDFNNPYFYQTIKGQSCFHTNMEIVIKEMGSSAVSKLV